MSSIWLVLINDIVFNYVLLRGYKNQYLKLIKTKCFD